MYIINNSSLHLYTFLSSQNKNFSKDRKCYV